MATEAQIRAKYAIRNTRHERRATINMQNKPNFRKSQMNVSICFTKDYENKSDWTLGENKPKTKPIFVPLAAFIVYNCR